MWLNAFNGLVLAATDHGATAHRSREPLPGWEADAENLLFVVVDVGIVTIALGIVICLFRLLRGPSLIDRGVASDALSFQVVGLAILMAIRFRNLIAFDAVLILSLIGFIGTIAFAQYIGRRRSAV